MKTGRITIVITIINHSILLSCRCYQKHVLSFNTGNVKIIYGFNQHLEIESPDVNKLDR